MEATKTTFYDGIAYKAGDTIPELGSVVCTSVNGNQRHYEGLNADAGKLPKVATYPQYEGLLMTGSTFTPVDVDKIYKYESTTDTWYSVG